MKRLLFLIVLFSQNCFAQKQGNIWYFGGNYANQGLTGAGLDFNSGVTVALTNSAMNYTERSASYCNSAGQLLFYAKGIYLYEVRNKNGVIEKGKVIHR